MRRVWGVLLLGGLLGCGIAGAADVVRLVSSSREPYIGPHLPDQGYVFEVAKSAFARVGYDVDLQFYPLARARLLVQNSRVDAIAPVYLNEAEGVVYSDPFPGDVIGLLALADEHADDASGAMPEWARLWRELSGSRIGVVRGGYVLPGMAESGDIVVSPANHDLQNLDKLYYQRLEYVQIDQYTAADLMAEQRPEYIGKLVFRHPLLARHSFHLAFSLQGERTATLLRAFNKGLAMLQADGTLTEIRARFGLLPRHTEQGSKHHLVIASVNNPEMLMLRSLSAEFERQHPDIELEWRVFDESTLRRRVLAELALGEGRFDVVTIGNYETPIWASRGWLLPFDSLPADYEEGDLFPAIVQSLSLEKHLYALPFYSEGIATYYRRDLFTNAGLVMPPKPDFADLRRLAEQLHHPERQQYGICLRGQPGWGINMALITSWVHAHGGRWFDDKWHPTLKTAPWRTVLRTYIELLGQFGPPEPQTLGYVENLKLFADGHCAIWVDATVAAGTLYDKSVSQVSSRTGMVAAPRATLPSSWNWSWAMAVPAYTRHGEAAQRFIRWATSRAYVREVVKQQGWAAVPPGIRRSVYADPAYRAQAPFAEVVEDALEQANVGRPVGVPYSGVQFVGIPEYAAFGNGVGYLVADVLMGRLTVDQALELAQQRVEGQMVNSGHLRQ